MLNEQRELCWIIYKHQGGMFKTPTITTKHSRLWLLSPQTAGRSNFIPFHLRKVSDLQPELFPWALGNCQLVMHGRRLIDLPKSHCSKPGFKKGEFQDTALRTQILSHDPLLSTVKSSIWAQLFACARTGQLFGELITFLRVQHLQRWSHKHRLIVSCKEQSCLYTKC